MKLVATTLADSDNIWVNKTNTARFLPVLLPYI